MIPVVSLLQDSESNLQMMFSIFDSEMAFDIIFSWATMLSFLVFPLALAFGHKENGNAFYPIIAAIQIAALLSLSRLFPPIHAGPAIGYYRIVIVGHLTSILVAVVLSLGAYFTMKCLRHDYKLQRFLVFICALILLSKVVFYAP